MKPSIFSPHTQVKSSGSARKVLGTPREIFAPASPPIPPTALSVCHELCTISLDPGRAAGKISSRRNRELQFHGHFSVEPDVAICNGNGTDDRDQDRTDGDGWDFECFHMRLPQFIFILIPLPMLFLTFIFKCWVVIRILPFPLC